MFKNKLLFVFLVLLTVTAVLVAHRIVGAGDGSGGGMGGIIARLIS